MTDSELATEKLTKKEASSFSEKHNNESGQPGNSVDEFLLAEDIDSQETEDESDEVCFITHRQ